MQYINRNLDTHLNTLVFQDVSVTGAILIEGARQVGKTTITQTVLKKSGRPFYSIDLEDDTLFRQRIDNCQQFTDFEELLADELGFHSGDGSILFIDEAQESRQLGRFVRYMKERWRGVQVLLTGSSLTRLFRDETRYPVGRVTRLHMAPFDFSEFLIALGRNQLAANLSGDAQDISIARHGRYLELFDQFLSVGGMPEVVLLHASGGDYPRRQLELLADLQQDFLRLFGEDNIDTVMNCLRSVANFVGSPSKISTVIKTSQKKNRKTAESIFSRLEQWAIVLNAVQRGPSPESAQAYHPKRYLFDTGLLRRLREAAVPQIKIIDTMAMAERRPLGGILENQVAIAIHHQTRVLHGWKRSSAGSEIDFIIEHQNQRIPVECKAAIKIKMNHLKGLRAYLESYEIGRGVVVSFAPYQEIKVDGRIITNVPAYLLNSWLPKELEKS